MYQLFNDDSQNREQGTLGAVNEQVFDRKIRFLNSKEAAEFLRTSPGNIRKMVCQGRLRAYKRGRTLLFLPSDLISQIKKRGGIKS